LDRHDGRRIRDPSRRRRARIRPDAPDPTVTPARSFLADRHLSYELLGLLLRVEDDDGNASAALMSRHEEARVESWQHWVRKELWPMATYVELPKVRTWYDERGEGDPLVLMHGGAVDASFFAPNIEALAARFRVLAPDLRGHGHTPDGEDHYPVVVRKEVEMDLREPTLTDSDLAGVGARTLVMASDDDLITLEHTLALYRGLRHSELAVVPGTSHFLTQEKPDLCNAILVDFLAGDPVETVAPLRRGATSPTV
jgi:hypothetical protein